MNYDQIIEDLRNHPRLTDKDNRVYLLLRKIQARQRSQLPAVSKSQKLFQEPKGPFSGLTRAELRASGTCEPDWF